MKQTAGYFIVEASAMPEIFRKVAEAKRLLETGEETTVNRAAQAVGISRSAYYKYTDAVRPFNDMLHGRIVTFQTMLKDEPGILSGLLNVFAGTGVNILTINQNIPVNEMCIRDSCDTAGQGQERYAPALGRLARDLSRIHIYSSQCFFQGRWMWHCGIYAPKRQSCRSTSI